MLSAILSEQRWSVATDTMIGCTNSRAPKRIFTVILYQQPGPVPHNCGRTTCWRRVVFVLRLPLFSRPNWVVRIVSTTVYTTSFYCRDVKITPPVPILYLSWLRSGRSVRLPDVIFKSVHVKETMIMYRPNTTTMIAMRGNDKTQFPCSKNTVVVLLLQLLL